MARTGPKPIPVEVRFWRFVHKTDGCWLWTGATNGIGYGRIGIHLVDDPPKRHVYAHRLSYEMHREPIPDGMVLDHLCRNPGCVRPDHLEVVTIRENLLRGESPAAKNARKTRCFRDHPLVFNKSGGRRCNTCAREAMRARREGLPNAAPCSIPGCDRKAMTRGLCDRHYQQQYKSELH